MASEGDRIQGWSDSWDAGRIGFHKSDVHSMLIKHFNRLFSDGKGGRVFVPLCGKTLDMRWMADQNVSVVGLDGVRKSIEQFFSEQDLKFTTDQASQLGDGCEKFKSADKNILLYRGDMLNFSPSIEGTFDAVWDRGSIVALNREDVPAYAAVIKSLLKSGGHCLVEVFEYDVNIMKDEQTPHPPPPHPMSESELKKLYEPEMTVEHLERDERKLAGKDVHTSYYLLTKV